MLIGPDGTPHGVVTIAQARAVAAQADLDLVEVAPHADPPVVRVADWGKMAYQASIREKEQRRHTGGDTKEIRLRPAIGDHDFAVKVRKVIELLGQGHRVRTVVQMRGRMVTHPELAVEAVERLIREVADAGKIDSRSTNGRDHVVMFVPAKTPGQPKGRTGSPPR